MKKAGKLNMMNILAATAGGGVFNAAITMAATKINGGNNVINRNFMNAKGVGGLLVGTGLLYFAKSDTMKAAAYGIIGAGGATLSNKVIFATGMNTIGPVEEPAQGIPGVRRATGGKRQLTDTQRSAVRAMVQRAVGQRSVSAPGRGQGRQPNPAMAAQNKIVQFNPSGNLAMSRAMGC